jgi:dTMP kinase
MNGFYVALEGGEGAGKSTVAALLGARLRAAGHEVVLVREPGGTVIGDRIRDLVLHGEQMTPWTEAMLFAAQRAQLAAEVISPALADGAIVVADRSYYSSLAYQGFGRDLGVDLVRMVNEAGLQGVVPDLVVVLLVEPEEGLARQRVVDRIGGEGVEFVEKVQAAYRRLAALEPDRVFLMDGSESPEGLVDRVAGLVEARRGQ